MAYWHDRPATAAVYVAFCLLIVLLRVTSALQSVPDSPCESVCADAGTLEDDVVCLDADYQSLEQGQAFRKCVSCQLNSTAVDTAKNETDVEWGLCMILSTLPKLPEALNNVQWPSATRWRDACLQSPRRTSLSAVPVKSAAPR